MFLRDYTLKNAGLFFLTQMLGSACWVILLGCFYIFTQVLGYIFFNLNAGFNLLGHFIGLFLICITHVLGSFSVTKLLGYFFLPNRWFEPVSNETTQLLSYSQSAGFLSLLQEREVFSAAELVHFFSEIKVCIHLISFIKSLLCCKLYYFTQHNIRMRCQSAASAVVTSHYGNAFCLA